MKNFFQKNNNPQEFFKEIRVQEYMSKYIKELQRHFDVSDSKMRKILYQIYQEMSPLNVIKSWLYMIKSKYIDKITLKDTKNGS